MVTSSYYYQPLLNPPKTTQKTTHKILLFSLLATLFFSLLYLCFTIFQSYYSNPHSNILSLSDEAGAARSDGQKLLEKILSAHVSDIDRAIDATKNIHGPKSNGDQSGAQAVADCLELMDLSRDRVVDSIKSLTNYPNYRVNDDITTWLSAVLTNHVTCLDQLHNYPHLSALKSTMEEIISRSRGILAIQAKISGETKKKKNHPESSRYPTWVRRRDRKLLEGSGSEMEADVVVTKDGSGNFTTVTEGVTSAPEKGKKRYVIYVKEGVYEENVEVGKKKKNVMIVGDGMNLTVITGSLNFVDGSTTFRSATLAAVGDGFILQDISIQNTAGPEKHQAVALRVGADQSVINRCKIDAYQDTLYAHSLRQFYTYSSISGTVDFIFGNAAVVLQNCELIARKPMDNQKNMVTAQGRTDPNQNTGTSIQCCDIVADPDLGLVQAQFPTFLGRPWQNFSRTVVMQSYIGDHVDPKGWAEWDKDFALDTLYYAEYMNEGPGANTSKRVNWTGYQVNMDPLEANKFTVGEFIQGQEWLDSAGVTYIEGL